MYIHAEILISFALKKSNSEIAESMHTGVVGCHATSNIIVT